MTRHTPTHTLLFRASFAVVAIGLGGCAKTKAQTVETTPPPAPAAVKAESPATDAATKRAISEIAANFRRVHFEFDSSNLTKDTRDALLANTEIMRRYPAVTVEIQGHCDDRGTTEYNLSLGERRARAIQDYMKKAGVETSRLTVISFGKERPLEPGESESAWSKNRRAEFRVLAGSPEMMAIRGTTD